MTLMLPKYVPARKSQLNFYRTVPLYFQNQSQDFMLYKPAGIKLSEMRIKDERYPDKLYLKRIDKIQGIREVQKEFNRRLKNDIQSKNMKNPLTYLYDEYISMSYYKAAGSAPTLPSSQQNRTIYIWEVT